MIIGIKNVNKNENFVKTKCFNFSLRSWFMETVTIDQNGKWFLFLNGNHYMFLQMHQSCQFFYNFEQMITLKEMHLILLS